MVEKLGHEVRKYIKFLNCHNSIILKLEHRSKAQHVDNSLGYLNSILNLRWQKLGKRLPWPQFKNSEIFQIGSFWHQIWKDRQNYHRKSYFDADDFYYDVTVRLWTLPSIFMFILHHRPISCWDSALWSWLSRVVCPAQLDLFTHWTCVHMRLHKNRSSS